MTEMPVREDTDFFLYKGTYLFKGGWPRWMVILSHRVLRRVCAREGHSSFSGYLCNRCGLSLGETR
jgi:hypothetical protein